MSIEKVLIEKGARFYRNADGHLMFSYRLDAHNVIGPRPATPADISRHNEAFQAFDAEAVTEEIAPVPVKRGPGRPPKVREAV